MNVVATVLLTKPDNPMCPGCDNYKPDVKILDVWLRSLRGCSAMVLHDELTVAQWDEAVGIAEVPVSFFQVDTTDENVYHQRWRHLLEFVEGALRMDWVFLTDGSDVRMLNEPWGKMERNTLYVGSENDTIANRWIVANHPSIKAYAEASPSQPLANAGIVGGTRSTVAMFIERLIERCAAAPADLTDMGAFNLTLAQDWEFPIVTGHPVHTEFGKWARSDKEAWFAHK